MRLIRISFAFALFAPHAFGDQCAWISQAEANKAVKILKGSDVYLSYCELCDGDKPNKIDIKSVTTTRPDDKHFEVMVNGEGIDLAYAFVPTKQDSKQYENLSKLVGCSSTGVSRYVTWPKEAGDAGQNDWSGSYGNDTVLFNLAKTTAGPTHTIQVSLSSKVNGNDRGEFTGTAELERDRLRLDLPFPGCSITLTRKNATLSADTVGNCGAFGLYIKGNYNKRS